MSGNQYPGQQNQPGQQQQGDKNKQRSPEELEAERKRQMQDK